MSTTHHEVYVHGVARIEVHTLRRGDGDEHQWRVYKMYRGGGDDVPCFEIATICQEPCKVQDYNDIRMRPHGYLRQHCRTTVQMLDEDLTIQKSEECGVVWFKEPGFEVGAYSDSVGAGWAPAMIWNMEEDS